MTQNNKPNRIHSVFKFLIGFLITGIMAFMLGVVVRTIGDKQGWWEDKITIRTYTTKGYKLNPGDPVYYSDLVVGEISNLKLLRAGEENRDTDATVEITMNLLKKHADFIPENTFVTVPLWNVFAHELYLETDAPDTSSMSKPANYLQDQMILPFSEKNLATQVRELLEKVDKEIIPGVKDFANMLQEKNTVIGDMIDDITQRMTELGSTIANLNEVSEKMNRGDGTIARLINEDTTVVLMNETLTLMKKDMQNARKMIGLITTLTRESRALIKAVETKYKLSKYKNKKKRKK